VCRQLDTAGPHREHARVSGDGVRAPLVLASASPRRHELLSWLGLEFVVEPAEVDECPRTGETAPALVRRLASAKASAVAARRPRAWVLGCDTVVEIGGEILGKPADASEAAAMIGRLAGNEHRVATGFALLAPGGGLHAEDVILTAVRFRALDAREISTYVARGESPDKAGGYAIQGIGAGLIERIDGSFTNVIGLPLVEVRRVLEEAGLLGR
jgi:septum formation protein